eukprot:537422-Amphidinium_carterae.1
MLLLTRVVTQNRVLLLPKHRGRTFIRVGVLDEGVLNSHPRCIATRQKDRAVGRREDLRCQLTRK